MYLHTDFVTHLPIQENQKVVLFFIAKPAYKLFSSANIAPVENMTYIDRDYQPISIPFVAHYGKHGDFILDESHTQTNVLAWIMMSNHHASENMPLPKKITEHDYRELFNEHIGKNTAISVTDFNSYQTVTNYFMHKPIQQGVFTLDDTYAEDYEARKQELLEEIKTVDNTVPMTVFQLDWGDMRSLVQPNMIQGGNSSRIDYDYRDDQLEIAKITNATIHIYYNQWGIFQSYLTMIRVPFAPVAGLGGQEAHIDALVLYAQQVQQQVKNHLTKSIQQAIEYEYALDPKEYEEDIPEFVALYNQLSSMVKPVISDDQNTEQIKSFADSLTLEQLKLWHSTI